MPRHELRLTLHRGNPTSSQRHPTFTDRNGVLVDESSGWLSKIHFSPGVTRATFALRDQSEFGRAGDAYMAKWVAGAVRVALALVAPRVGGLLLHGAASSSGIALLGPSGAGKTTLARRLSGALCDDALLVFKRDRWRLSGTPVPGREGLPRSGAEATLATLVHLVPAQPLAMAPLSEAQALSALLQRVLYFTAPDAAFFATAHDLVRSVRSYRLTSSLDDDVTPLLAASLAGRAA